MFEKSSYNQCNQSFCACIASKDLRNILSYKCNKEIVNHCSLSLKVKVVPPYWAAGMTATRSTTTKVCANGEWANCKCAGTVYYGRKFRQGKPGHGQTTDLAKLKQFGSYMTKSVSSSIQCDYRSFMGYRGGRRLDGEEEEEDNEEDQDPMRAWHNYCICVESKTTPPSNTYGGSWTISVELGGAINMLEKIFGLFSPPCPVYGEALMSGGIIFKNIVSCSDIPFYLEGWAAIGFVGGVNLIVTKIPVLSMSLKVGAKIVSVAAHVTRHATDRRRGGGWFSDRRRHTWANRWHEKTCDVEVSAKVDGLAGTIKGWLLLQYWIFRKEMKISMGVESHIGLCPWACWVEKLFSKDIYNAKIR